MLLLPLLPGLAQGVFSGITGALGSNAQANAANKLAIAQYKQAMADRLATYTGEINRYNTSKLQYKQGLRSSTEALYAGLGQNQEWLNDIRKNLGVQSVNTLTDMVMKQGQYAASDMAAGRSSGRVNRMFASQRGQQQALAQESLAQAYGSAKTKNEQLLIQKRRTDMANWLPLTYRPNPGFAPTKPILQGTQNVFTAGLLGGLKGAAMSAVDVLGNQGFKGLGIGGSSGYTAPSMPQPFAGNSSYFRTDLTIPGIRYSG
jgi:hypothetical protein